MGATRRSIAGAGVARAVVALVCVAVVTGSCSAGSARSASLDRSASSRAGSLGSALAAGGATAGAAKAASELPTVAGHQIAFTVEVSLAADHVADAARRVQKLAADAGGFVFGQQSSYSGVEEARLTLKVPADRLDQVVRDVEKLGTLARDVRRADDVTAQAVDLDARITAATSSLERVRALTAKASSIGDVTSVDGEITRRETELEQMLGQRRQLGDQVALATIEVDITRTPKAVAAASHPGDSFKNVPGVGRALASSINALVVIARVVGAGIGYAVPFGVVLGLPLLVVARVRRRRAPAALGA